MDLVTKVFIIAVAIIVVVGIVKFAVQSAPQPVSKAEAIANVTHYLQQSTPIGTLVNITSVTASQYSGSWHIIAGIIIDGTSPCPSYYVDSFDYPQYGFVSRLENNYTANCIVNGLNANYDIGYYPVAIAQSYSLNISQVKNFVSKFGYNNVQVNANHIASQQINGMNYSNIWIVYYTAPAANYSVQVYLRSNGSLITAT